MDAADEAWVYFSPDAVAHKKLPALSAEDVPNAFGSEVRVFDSSESLQIALENPSTIKAMALMSSGNFGGIDLEATLAKY